MILKNRKQINEFIQKQNITIVANGVTSFNKTFISSDKDIENFIILALRRDKEIQNNKSSQNYIYFEDYIPNNKILTLRSSIAFENKKIQEVLLNLGKLLIIPYKSRPEITSFTKKSNAFNAINDDHLCNNILENKINFREIISNKSLLPQYIVRSLNREMDFTKISDELRSNHLVIQIPNSSGGRGTRIVKNSEEFNKSVKELKVILKESNQEMKLLISKFETGIPASISVVASRWGIFFNKPQVQLNDIPITNAVLKGNGVFNGHDWQTSLHLQIDYTELYKEVKDFGEKLYSMGYKGFFGLDIIIQKQKVKIIECNPRLTGVLPTLDQILRTNNKISFMQLHILEYLAEFLKLELEIDIKKIQYDLQNINEGAHLMLFSPLKELHTFKTSLKPGIYRLNSNKKINFLREGYGYDDLNQGEFMITELSSAKYYLKNNDRIGRLLFKSSILNSQWETKISKHVELIIKEFYLNSEFIPNHELKLD